MEPKRLSIPKSRVVVAVVGYLLLVVAKAVVGGPTSTAWATAWMAIASWWLCPKLITVALWCSAVGDLVGQVGMLLPQMGTFAIAHICLIVHFGRKQRPQQQRRHKWTQVAVVGAVSGVVIGAVATILPHVTSPIYIVAVVVYALLIGTMCALAMVRGSLLSAAGGALFVLSDLLLAIGIFVPGSNVEQWWVMGPYYGAILLLTTGNIIGPKEPK